MRSNQDYTPSSNTDQQELWVKTCSCCKVERPIVDFTKDKRSVGGIASLCKICKKQKDEDYRSKNAEKIKQHYQEYYRINSEDVRKRRREYYNDNKDKAMLYNKEYNTINNDKVKTYHNNYRLLNKDKIRNYRETHKDSIRAKRIEHFIKNRDKINARCRKYHKVRYKEKIGMYLANHHKRRALKRNTTGTHTSEQIKKLLLKQKGKCAYCKKDIRKSYHIDHIVALANGGDNGIYNIQLLCPTCNLKKGSKDPIDFSQQQGRLL